MTDFFDNLMPLTDAQLAALVRDLPRRPLGLGAQVRHSLAGTHGKLLVVRRADGGWGLPVNAGTRRRTS